MESNIHLLINNILSVVSLIIMLGLAFFTYLNGRKHTANIAFALLLLSAAAFLVYHTIGINLSDPYTSRTVLMFNLSLFLSGIFQVHAVLALVGKAVLKRGMIIFFYVTGLLFIVFFLLSPDLFLLPSLEKMYFPNYYNPGTLNWVRLIFLDFIALPYSIYELVLDYRKSRITLERKQHIYFILSLIIAYSILFIPNFLVYDINIDPLLGMLFSLPFAIFFLYGAIKYELFNIRIIAKEAFIYSIAVALVGGLITFLNYSNNWIETVFPGFPAWTISLISAIIAVTASVIVWRHLKEGDILKYEFITTVTHKFRTPLTYIRWATENLSKTQSLDDLHKQAENIQIANNKLIQLTTLLVEASGTEGGYEYHMKRVDISGVLTEVIGSLQKNITKKNLSISQNVEPNLFALSDPLRIKFVIQVLLENAVHYSGENGKIYVSLIESNEHIIMSIEDSGIGMTAEGLQLLFTKFYRGEEARIADTEGMGIGLYISKEIIKRHNGKIWAESAGLNKGSTFFVKLKSLKQ